MNKRGIIPGAVDSVALLWSYSAFGKKNSPSPELLVRDDQGVSRAVDDFDFQIRVERPSVTQLFGWPTRFPKQLTRQA